MLYIYSFFFWIYLGLVTAVLVLIGMPKALLFKGSTPYKPLAVIWSKAFLFYLGVKADVRHLDRIKKDTNYVFMGNHLSYVDIFLLMYVLRDRNLLFMAKKELFKIPLLGFAMNNIGMIPIEREDKKDGLKSLLQAAKKISEGYSVLLFPEGTRSKDGTLGPFKRGAFLLAVRTGNKIAPFILHGTNKALPKSGFKVYPFKKVTLEFLEPVDAAGMKDRELLAAVREVMLNELGQSDSGAGEQSGGQAAEPENRS
jgi:1-acyl-sn-glycerol-3-phosphate acyltransferase